MFRAISTITAVAILCLGAQATAKETEAKTVAQEPLQKPKVKLDPLAVKMKKDDARQQYLLGKKHVEAKQYVEAIKCLRKAHAIEPLPELLFEMAATYGRMGKMQKAFDLHRRYVDSYRDPLKRLVAAAKFGSIMRRVRQDAKAKTTKMAKQ
jgi:tetratricopeptide (TPR) repeat protein